MVFLFLQPILWRGWKIVNLMEIFTQWFMIVQNFKYLQKGVFTKRSKDFLVVAQDFVNRWTDVVLLNELASHRSSKGL